MIEERADALWPRDVIEAARVGEGAGASAHRGRRSIRRPRRAAAPAASSRRARRDGLGYVLADGSVGEVRPAEWAAAAIALYRRSMPTRWSPRSTRAATWCAAVMREVDAGVPVKCVHATRGKWLRAEPVAALYAQGACATSARLAGTGRRDGRLRRRRALRRPLARPARRAGLGGDRADAARRVGGAED